MRAAIYVHGAREDCLKIGEKLGLSGEALQLFKFAAEEYCVEGEVLENGVFFPRVVNKAPMVEVEEIRAIEAFLLEIQRDVELGNEGPKVWEDFFYSESHKKALEIVQAIKERCNIK